MNVIPLTRARHAGNFARALTRRGMPVEGYLDRSHLPVDLIETGRDDSVISALNMLDFAEYAAADTGIGDLGYWAGLMPIDGYGDFGARVVEAPSLHTAIQTFCSTVRGECSEADYYLMHDGSRAWFCHGRGGSDPLQQQHELYTLMIMVQVIQLALGSHWRPARIRLQRRDEAGVADNDFLLSTNIEFGAAVTGIALGLRDLATPAMGSRDDTRKSDAPNPGRHPDALPVDPLIALQELVRTQLRQSTPPSLELAAEVAGVSPRTLQRYLKSKATSFSGLVDQVRFNMAVPLLNDGAMTITDIAYELGYSNVTHFSRAFSRITGMSPRFYRGVLKK